MMLVHRRNVLLLLVLLILTACTAPAFAWKFASIADSRGDDNGVNLAVFEKIINQINKENVDLVIFQGDAVSGYTDDATLSSQMDTWLKVMEKLNCPWYYTPGNHEIGEKTSQKVLQEKVDQPMNGPPDAKEMVYSFNHKNAHFVSLNSNQFDMTHKVHKWWLKYDLSNTSQPHVFVMAHEPAFPAGPHKGGSLDAFPKERDRLWQIMEEGRVAMFFCGHEHLYKRSQHGSIIQVINGSCGAPIYEQPGSIGTYHYVIVDVSGMQVRSTTYDMDGKQLDAWQYTQHTSRSK